MQYTSETMLIQSKDDGETGVFAEISAEAAGWEYLNMAAMRMNKWETYSDNTRGYENAIVILGGRCNIRTSDGEFLDIGRRPNVFSGMPYALYLSRSKDFEIEALTDGLEIASRLRR